MPRYSHKRPPAAHTASIQFDAGGVSDRKPTAAKSAGTLGKWGVTSFTSIRSSIVNGSTHDGTSSDARAGRSPAAPPADPFSFESNTPGAAPVRKVKKFFKSRNAPPSTGPAATDARRQLPITRPVPQPPAPPPAALHDDKDELESKKFFSSPALPQPLRDTTTNRANSLSPREPPAAPQAPRMPPLKLRISRDKDTGDLTAVSGSPPDGSGGGGARRRRPPAAPAPPQPTKAARYKSPPPPRVVSPDPPSPAADPAPPAATGDEDEIGGRPVRRTRRAAAVEARQKVAKSVYVEEEDEELVALPVRGRRGQKRRPSSGDLSSAPAPAVTATAPATVPELEPVVEDTTPVSDPAPPPVESHVSGAEVPPNGVESPEAEVPPSEPSPPPPPTPPSPPSPPPTQPITRETRRQGVTTKPAAAPSPTKMPVLTPAPTLVQHPAPTGTTLASTAVTAVASAAPAAVETKRPEVPAPPVTGYQPPQAAPQPEVRQTRSSSQPTTQPTTLLPNPTPSPAAAPAAPPAPVPAISDQGSEPVNLSTRQPAADLERELSNLFGETPTPAPVAAPAAPAAEEPTSRVYRKGIKDLGRYQRTQETRASPAAPAVSGPNSPQPYKDLERQLELMESGRAAPGSVSTPASVIGSDSGVGGSSQESDSVPPLARASTEPVLAPSGRSVVPTTAAAATEKAAPSEPKKGSIFKTRAGQGRAARARYNHRWTDDKDEAAPPAAAAPAQNNDAPSAASALDFTDDTPPPSGPGGGLNSRLTRVSTWHGADPNSSQQPVTSVRVDRNAKEYYTVIKNVKKAYQIQEFGEFQEYNDDIDYIMDALQPTNSLST
ncbi:nascent polypeptide-associated complex subunit alpha, muscle-specific form-like, partial [Amphibalanus amphitrite]|uniref:nascent polypeptide-associated complex subunit alpha, muscle-specific form-like n=1 Tax=Amphibalanus amphitrite TaxID=1232801 RepID=UPI001C910A44